MEKIRDKYVFEDKPDRDIDFIEILLPADEFDKFINKYGTASCKKTFTDEDKTSLLKAKRKRERILKKVWKAASVCLTERQYEIFSLRYRAGLKGVQIAQILRVDQSNIPRVLRRCTDKLKKMLGCPSRLSNRGFYIGNKPYRKKASRYNRKARGKYRYGRKRQHIRRRKRGPTKKR